MNIPRKVGIYYVSSITAIKILYPMAICSKCLKRLIFWLVLTFIGVVAGLLLDLIIFQTTALPVYIRIIGFIGIVLHQPVLPTEAVSTIILVCNEDSRETRF